MRFVNIDPHYFDIDILEQRFEPMLGRSLINPAGDKQFLEFNARSGLLFANSEQYVGNYFLVLSYKSTMEFSDTVCINPSLYEVYDSGCEVQDVKSYSGQGAPLAVTRMEEIVSPGAEAAVEFRLLLRNRGRGKVGQVNFKSARMGNDALQCEFLQAGVDTKSIKFKDNRQEAMLLCKKENLRSLDSYTTTLFVDFSYDYELEVPHRLNLAKGTKTW